MKIEDNLKLLKITIPQLAKPVGTYVPAIRTGHLVFTSGQLPLTDGRLNFKGRVGKEVRIEKGQRAVKIAVINALSAVQWVVGDLNKVKKVVKLTGYVCSAIGFNDQAKVMNAGSELLTQIFGEEEGAHARTTIGCIELPLGSCVEVDLIVEVK